MIMKVIVNTFTTLPAVLTKCFSSLEWLGCTYQKQAKEDDE